MTKPNPEQDKRIRAAVRSFLAAIFEPVMRAYEDVDKAGEVLTEEVAHVVGWAHKELNE